MSSQSLGDARAAGKPELVGLYWTVSGPVVVHFGREWSYFSWADRCAEARKVGLRRAWNLARRPRARARDRDARRHEAGDGRQRAHPARARVPDGLVPRPGRRSSAGLGQDARPAARGGVGARGASRQGREHPRHPRVALTAHRAVRRALRRRRRAHGCEDRLRVDAARHERAAASTPSSRWSAARRGRTEASRSTPGTCRSSASRPTISVGSRSST